MSVRFGAGGAHTVEVDSLNPAPLEGFSSPLGELCDSSHEEIKDGSSVATLPLSDSRLAVPLASALRVLVVDGFDGLIVGVTGHVFEEDVAAFLDAGADLVLAKPLAMNTVQMLLTCIAENISLGSVTLTHPSGTGSRLQVEQKHRLLIEEESSRRYSFSQAKEDLKPGAEPILVAVGIVPPINKGVSASWINYDTTEGRGIVQKNAYDQMIESRFTSRESEKRFPVINTLLVALSNATILEANAEELSKALTMSTDLHFNKIIDTFLSHNPQAEIVSPTQSSDTESKAVLEGDEEEYWTEQDPWQHMSSVVCNLCQCASGREFVVKNYLRKIAGQVRSRNPVRQRGAVGCVKSYILMPLVVGIAFTDREKEGMDPILWIHAEQLVADSPARRPDCKLDVMKMLLECIVLLCQRRMIREELRKRKVYAVVKNFDTTIEDESISESIYEIVNFLMGEEDPSCPPDA
eukprot:gene29004-38046_t